MIKLEHTVLPSPEQMQFVIEGMRNPMNSWDKSDSVNCDIGCEVCKYDFSSDCENALWAIPEFGLGPNDYSLMKRLAKAGTVHRKFMRMMPVYVRITAPLYWWKEFDTYKVGTVANSCSTMHKIQSKEFIPEDFSTEHLSYQLKQILETIMDELNDARLIYLRTRKKDDWWQMIQLLPSSYNQARNVMLNYEVLANMYHSRKNHKLDEWRKFCKWIENLPYAELITGEEVSD